MKLSQPLVVASLGSLLLAAALSTGAQGSSAGDDEILPPQTFPEAAKAAMRGQSPAAHALAVAAVTLALAAACVALVVCARRAVRAARNDSKDVLTARAHARVAASMYELSEDQVSDVERPRGYGTAVGPTDAAARLPLLGGMPTVLAGKSSGAGSASLV
jgi:hypothetical protein